MKKVFQFKIMAAMGVLLNPLGVLAKDFSKIPVINPSKGLEKVYMSRLACRRLLDIVDRQGYGKSQEIEELESELLIRMIQTVSENPIEYCTFMAQLDEIERDQTDVQESP